MNDISRHWLSNQRRRETNVSTFVVGICDLEIQKFYTVELEFNCTNLGCYLHVFWNHIKHSVKNMRSKVEQKLGQTLCFVHVFSLSHFQDYKLTGFNVNQNHEWKTKKLSSAWKRQCEFSCKCWHFNDTQKNMNSSFTLNTLFSLGNLFNISFWFLLFVIMILTSRNINSMRVIFLLRTRNTKSEHKIENYSNGK